MNKGKALPKEIGDNQLQDNWDLAIAQYARAFRRMRLLDAADRGRLWDAVNANLPSYQILPDTNHVAYIKQNLVASIYSVGKSARLGYNTKMDRNSIEEFNLALDWHWHLLGIGYYQMQAGSRAALLNVGITQVGWDANLSGGSAAFGDYYQGMPVLKNVDPMKFMRDPFAESLDTAGYCMTYDYFHKSVLQQNPMYRDEFRKFLVEHKDGTVPMTSVPGVNFGDRMTTPPPPNAGYSKLIIHWIRDGETVYEIHTIDNEWVLAWKTLDPAVFPFAECYCNLPEGDIIGTSECAKVFANSVAVNVMNSMVLTADYKNQRPPRFVNNQSMLNIATFSKHGNDADHTFLVNGNGKDAVYYHQFPVPSPQAQAVTQMLGMDIQTVSGVDPRYTGRDSGSVLTTGGIENMLNQVTLIDAPKVLNYEKYTKRLTQLIVGFLLKYGMKRRYIVNEPNTGNVKYITIDFEQLDPKVVNSYEINISTELPKNKERIAQKANMLMEKQMQYAQNGGPVELITPEEWLSLQDLPFKELMYQRMGIQRSQDYTEKVSQILFSFSGLTQNGMPPQQAIAAVADMLKQQETPVAGGPSSPATVPQPDGMGAASPMPPAGGPMPMPMTMGGM